MSERTICGDEKTYSSGADSISAFCSLFPSLSEPDFPTNHARRALLFPLYLLVSYLRQSPISIADVPHLPVGFERNELTLTLKCDRTVKLKL